MKDCTASRKNSRSKTYNLKKTRIRNSQSHVLIRICSKIISTNTITCLWDRILKRDILLFLEKNEKRCEKNLYFAYNKSDHQIRNCCFKKKIISDKSLTFKFIQIDINKLTSDFCQMKIYANLKIKILNEFQIIQVLMNFEVFINYVLQMFLIKNK